MEEMNKFCAEHGSKVITVLLILLYLKSCGVDKEMSKLRKEVTETSAKTTEIINQLPTANDLKIEGLNAEKRMIQATDRKLLDVQRQTEIENEIKKLQDK
jgi:hypothetical protein